MYDPQHGALDFEIGAFGDRLKKFGKKLKKGVTKFTDYTIVKPHEYIGSMVGGKKFGRKLGKFTQKVTHLGLAAGAAGAAPTLATAIGAGVAGKKIKKALTKRKTAQKKPAKAKKRPVSKSSTTRPCCDNAEAAKVAALLTKSLGGPLGQANAALKLAAIQRKATAEHARLMTESEFRKKVLAGIANMAADGNTACERTVRVILGR